MTIIVRVYGLADFNAYGASGFTYLFPRIYPAYRDAEAEYHIDLATLAYDGRVVARYTISGLVECMKFATDVPEDSEVALSVNYENNEAMIVNGLDERISKTDNWFVGQVDVQ